MSARLLVAVANSGLPRMPRAILAVLCEELRGPGLTWQVSMAAIGQRLGCSGRTVTRHMPALVGVYLNRRDVFQQESYFSVTDPATWPLAPTAAMVDPDNLSDPAKMADPDKLADVFPVLDISPEGTDVPSCPAVAERVGEGDSRVIRLEDHRADVQAQPDTAAADAKPKRGRTRKPKAPDDGETFVSATGHRLAVVRDIYHRHCCTPDGADESPEDMPRVFRLNASRQKAFNDLCLALGDKASYQWFGMWFRWARANRWANGSAPDNGWQADFDWLLKVETLHRVRERKYRRHDPAGYIHELDPTDDPMSAPANDHPEARHAIG